MKLLDTNIIAYAALPQYAFLRPLVLDAENFTSVISMVEALGYHKISPAEQKFLESAFDELQLIQINGAVLQATIELRQQKKISLGDSIVAATALLYGLELVTPNSKDFKDIPGLTVVNPFAEKE